MQTTTEHRPRAFRLRAVLFDFDGTLTRPGALDFVAVKRAVGCPPECLLLEWIEALPAGAQRTAALAALERFEMEGAAKSQPNEGAEDLLRRLRALGLRIGVLTRNGRRAVDAALARFGAHGTDDFDVVVTRDDAVSPKPSPDGVSHAAAAMGVTAEETLVVGDFLLDMLAGRAAGAVTAYLTNGDGEAAVDTPGCPDGDACDFVVHGLAELDAVVRLGLPLPQGKLPNELLDRHLQSLAGGDPAVLLPAAVGEDVSALDMTGVEVLVAHGDPITLTGGDLGRYAVLVNANDIAASGGEPRWLLTTVLLPTGTTPSQAVALLSEISATAAAEDIVLVGGHTEVSAVVSRPVVSATMLGVVRRADLRDKREASPGDKVILTKRLAAEGTALLAGELSVRLRALGMADGELDDCRSLLDRLSIVPEARLATRFAGVRALHDVTEGGLATALRELAAACHQGITVHVERIPVFPETARVCELLGVDPLGLIASGSLLICCRPAEAEAVVTVLRDACVEAVEIGEVGEPGAGVTALERGRPAAWPEFAVDEAARVLGRGEAE
jgi:hydrogenase expression/formation protein HypE